MGQPLQLDLVQVDAFAERLFEGNPAAVMPLPWWLPDGLLLRLAAENNLSETAFLVPAVDPDPAAPAAPAYDLRWFTPEVEVDLCGHATLAAAAYLFEDVHPDASTLRFATRSGWLSAGRAAEGRIVLDFPAEPPTPVEADPVVVAALGVDVVETLAATDLVYVVATADEVRALTPDFAPLMAMRARGVMVTAPGDEGSGFDFVSRWFGPPAGIPEDPVTGSAHVQSAPYWAQRLGRDTLVARQLSARGGTVYCQVDGDRVTLTGGYRRYLTGRVTLQPDDLG